MADEYAKVQSMLDDNPEEEIEQSISKAAKAKNLLARTTGSAATGVANLGTRIAAGGMAAVQTTSVTSIATILSILFGVGVAANPGGDYLVQYRDDYLPKNDYECLDEYVDAYQGAFGTINDNPLAEQSSTVVKRLREINEWSKAYVEQKVPDSLVCTEESCSYYQLTGCPDGNHKVEKVEKGIRKYYDSSAKIDLANVMRIHDFFAAYGLTDVQIAAICGVATIESRIDFTSLEGYNLSGDRYNLDPSVTTSEYGFKPWAEGIGGSPIDTPTCIHEIAANTYSGPDQPIDYSAYSAKYSAIEKLGLGLVGFTDGPGFYNNTFLRNYADDINDKVTLIQRIVEGSRGWREELRQRAADTYHIAYGADPDAVANEDKRGTANHYVEKVVNSEFLFYKDDHAGEERTDFEAWDDREGKSSAWLYKAAAEEYKKAEKELEDAVDAYMNKADEYETKLNELKNTPWKYHTVNTSDDPNGAPLKNIEFKNHDLDKDSKKITTKFQDGCDPNKHPIDQYVSICEIEKLKECDKSDEEEPYLEYENPLPGAEKRNNIDVLYPKIEMKDVWSESDKDPAVTQIITVICNHGTGPGNAFTPPGNTSDTEPVFTPPSVDPYAPPWVWQAAYDAAYYAWQERHAAWQERERWRQEQTAADAAAVGAGGMPTAPTAPTPPSVPRPSSRVPIPSDYSNYSDYQAAYNEWLAAKSEWDSYDKAMQKYYIQMQQYAQNMNYFNSSGGTAFFTGSNPVADAEHDRIMALKAELEAMVEELKRLYQDMMDKKDAYEKTLEKVNKWAKIHAHDVVKFYNALQDYYTASDFDMESKIRDAAYSDSTIFGEVIFFSKAAYEYEFTEKITEESGLTSTPIKFKDLFAEIGDGTTTDADGNLLPTPQKLKLYYELWQNYAKYATNLPKNGKYINWWTPEVQLLFFVGGSYDAEKDEGLKVRDEYINISCGDCSKAPERDTTGKYYYDWMSSWKGEDYTSRDITTATKNFYYDMVSGGFDDGTLQLRTEYAYAYYYMFQYDSPYQQAINYANVGGEASKIMEEMIAEGRWQTNTSNTLSDAAMPHNDKWKSFQDAEITRQWEIDTSTSMSTSILSILGSKQNHTRVNLLTNVWTSCKYINVIENSTIGNSALYLVDNPLIYNNSDEFYDLKYGAGDNSATEPVSNMYKVVFNTINKRLENNGKTAMSGASDDGFNFVKTCVLWSGMDAEFENINNIDDLHDYLKEATSSVWQDQSEYQTDPDSEKAIGRGNSKIWEQRKLGPYYDKDGNIYYRYQWVLVPRVLGERNVDTDLKWYDDMRNDDAERGFGEPDEDLDKWDVHNVDEHDTNNTPSIAKGEDVDGYKRKLNENERIADWIRVDWECWDKECDECGGKGGHGDINLLCPGDLLVSDDKVAMWLGEEAVQSMFPLEKNSTEKLVYAGGDKATKLKTMDDATGFEWSKPCADYINHDTPCPTHGNLKDLPKTAEKEDPDSCNPYNPKGKWTVYRLITSNYTDEYRNAGIIFDLSKDGEWELWYEYRYKGIKQDADTRTYLERVREELGAVINTDYPRDDP